jgi:archaellum component FlaC
LSEQLSCINFGMPRVKKPVVDSGVDANIESLAKVVEKLTLKVESLEAEINSFKSGTSSKGSKRVKRIPAVVEVPKRPLSAYMIYCNEVRKSDKFTGKNVKDVVNEIAKQWKQLSTSDKEKYSHKAQVARDEYELKMKEFWSKTSEEDLEAENKRRRDNATNAGRKLLLLKKPKN